MVKKNKETEEIRHIERDVEDDVDVLIKGKQNMTTREDSKEKKQS